MMEMTFIAVVVQWSEIDFVHSSGAGDLSEKEEERGQSCAAWEHNLFFLKSENQ